MQFSFFTNDITKYTNNNSITLQLLAYSDTHGIQPSFNLTANDCRTLAWQDLLWVILLHVIIQVTGLRGFVITQITMKWLLACVCSLVFS